MDIQILTSSLSTVADLMMDAGVQCDSVSVGSIIEHYTQLISDGIGKAEELLTFQKEADS
ncbi:MAG: hypothetical protein D3906_01265 [Candidatus Electrothrix sp. AUS1_2]|nr:hypothetical protein [Candidatus Electrothrix sp. AUS1_2]